MEHLMSEEHCENSSTRQKQKQQKILACYEKEVFGQRGREMVVKNGQKKWNNLCTGRKQGRRTESSW